jgi:hypothetical protein
VSYPTHGAGSFCSAPPGAGRITTIGREKAANPLLASGDEDAFVKALLASLGTFRLISFGCPSGTGAARGRALRPPCSAR